MEFGILGPLEVRSGDGVVDVGAPKLRSLLAALLLDANRVVSVDRLVEALWDEEPPPTAVKALQLYVGQLRRLLGKERLVTKAPGYMLRVAPGELDLERFERLRSEGRFHEALAEWRGAPLADVAYERFAREASGRLEEVRLVCLQERIDQDLGVGRHRDLVGELEALVHEHPFRERLRGQLMLALYRSDRQAEALEAYQAARRTLVDELGIEPGRPLRELHQAVLNQDPALDLDVVDEPTVQEAAPRAAPAAPPEAVADDVRKTVTAVHVLLTVAAADGAPVDPEALRGITGRAFGEVEAAAARHGGTVETVASDAVTAVFGLPVIHEDDAVRGVRAAVEIRAALSALASELVRDRALQLDFGVGISTGGVIAGVASGAQLRATGAPLTLASRLAQAAGSGEVRFDAATRRLLGEAAGADAVDGAWRLGRLGASEAPEPRLVSPMIGRERERRRLADVFDQVATDRASHLFTVLGLAGVGKSRLVREFLPSLAGQALVARGRCLPYGEGITFWPLLEAVKEAVGAHESEPPEIVRGHLEAALRDEPDAPEIARRVGELIGLAETVGGAEEGFAGVRTLFQSLATTQPVVLVFDDIHWGEVAFLDLVEQVVDSARAVPLLLVCLARPELLDARPGWGGGKVNATSVLLEPLTDDDCSRLIENLVGDTELSNDVVSRIIVAAEGNPLFVEEMLAMLIDNGVLVREEGRWRAVGDVATVPVPPTIQALLAARLERLDADERSVIQRAAVEGKTFHEGAVGALAPESLRPAVATHLDALVRKELIRPDRGDLAGERGFRFRHLLIRDAAYDAIPKTARAGLHERFAQWLGAKTEPQQTSYEEILGYHLEQAYHYRAELGPVDDAARAVAREAAARLGAAAHRAFVRGDAPAAVNLMSRAVPLMPAGDPARVDLVPNVRVVQGLSGDLSWADRVLAEAVAAAAAGGDRRLEEHAVVQRAFLRLFTRDDVTADELLEVAERAISVFQEVGDDLGLARAWRLTAQAHYLRRRAGPSADASAEALEHARRAGDPLETREIVAWYCVALMLGPTPAETVAARCEGLLEEGERDPILEPTILSVFANAEAMRGNATRAGELLDRWRRAVDDLGDSSWLFPTNFGFVALADDPEAAERGLRPGYETLDRIGERSHFSSVAGLLARVVYARERYDEADRLTRESEEAARPNDIHSHILWRTTRAKVLARRGEVERADALAREAVGFAAGSDFLDSHGDALVDHAEVLVLGGRRAEAEGAIRQAIALYEQKGNDLSAAHARARLLALT